MVKCCELNAGMLRTPCQFQRKSKVSDGAGGWREEWLNLSGAATRCSFKALSGGERFQAQRSEAITRNRIVCRFFAGLTDSDRVVIGGRRFDITFIDDIELRGRWVRIDLSGGVAT